MLKVRRDIVTVLVAEMHDLFQVIGKQSWKIYENNSLLRRPAVYSIETIHTQRINRRNGAKYFILLYNLYKLERYSVW